MHLLRIQIYYYKITNPGILGLVISPCKIIHNAKKTDVEKLISGTYYHPLLIPHIACWVSVNFAVMISEVDDCYEIRMLLLLLRCAVPLLERTLLDGVKTKQVKR
jgi:hypothetical protein